MKKTKLLETIKILNGKIFYPEYHNRRMNRAREELFNRADTIRLEERIEPPASGLIRCRVVYEEEIESIEYIPYEIRSFKKFKLIESDCSYEYKYLNREELNRLYALRNGADDIIIIKNGLITDTTIANLAFHDGSNWLTPAAPLLAGTTRERLLEEKKIQEANITPGDLKNFSKMALLNAMLNFHEIKNIELLT
ncbi:MAG: hypothetical protein GY754_08635 [bacterium]|nr:hypothetical protein [bacterium]